MHKVCESHGESARALLSACGVRVVLCGVRGVCVARKCEKCFGESGFESLSAKNVTGNTHATQRQPLKNA